MADTSMEILGTVRGSPVMLENCCIFLMEGEEGLYMVLSTDRQAVKDYIFVREGERIQVAGSMLEQGNIKGIIVTEKARIEITKNIYEK